MYRGDILLRFRFSRDTLRFVYVPGVREMTWTWTSHGERIGCLIASSFTHVAFVFFLFSSPERIWSSCLSFWCLLAPAELT